MNSINRKTFCAAVAALAAFALWTAAVCFVDVEPIGPMGSAVGLVSINRPIHSLTGVHMNLYLLTDWLGLVPLAFALGFALLGFAQWLKRKKIRLVDRSILALGGFYLAVMAAYLLFERFVINYRPVLIDGYQEASYPSSTTMLVLCVMSTALMQFHHRIKKPTLRRWVSLLVWAFSGFMVVGRLVSGVHWFSDIVGGALLSAGLVLLYYSVSGLAHNRI